MTKLTNTNWTVGGIYMTPSDALYQNLEAAVTTGNLSENHLRKISGHAYSIRVDHQSQHIQFCNF